MRPPIIAASRNLKRNAPAADPSEDLQKLRNAASIPFCFKTTLSFLLPFASSNKAACYHIPSAGFFVLQTVIILPPFRFDKFFHKNIANWFCRTMLIKPFSLSSLLSWRDQSVCEGSHTSRTFAAFSARINLFYIVKIPFLWSWICVAVLKRQASHLSTETVLSLAGRSLLVDYLGDMRLSGSHSIFEILNSICFGLHLHLRYTNQILLY